MDNFRTIKEQHFTIGYVDKPDERNKLLSYRAVKQEKIEKYVKLLETLVKKNIDNDVSFKFLVYKISDYVPLVDAIKIVKIYQKRIQIETTI